MTKLLFTFLFLWVPSVFAGHVTGNGGDAVVCRYLASEIMKAELLDFYEGRVERNLPTKFDSRATMEENLDILFERLGHFDSYTKERLSNWRKTFFDEVKFLEGVRLVDIPDSDHISVPNGCEIEQLAVQKTPQFPGDKRYTINKDLWDRMDSANQAGLVMHELIYRQLLTERSPEEVNSTAVRFLNSVLAADRMDVFTLSTYLQFLRDNLYVKWTNWDGYLAYLPSFQFSEDGEILAYFATFSANQNRIQIGGVYFKMAEGISLSFRFDPKTRIRTYRLNLQTPDVLFIGFRQFFISDLNDPRVEVDLNEDGDIIALRGVSFYWKSPYWEEKKLVDCKQISFWRDRTLVCQNTLLEFGSLRDAMVQYDEVLFDPNNRVRWASRYPNSEFGEGISVTFYPDQTFKKISCEETEAGFSRDRSEFLRCAPGEDIFFLPDGTVGRGGYLIRESTVAGGIVLRLEHGKTCSGGREIPIYEIDEQTKFTKSGLLHFDSTNKERNSSFLLEHADGSKIEVNPNDFIEFDSEGRVTSVTRQYCPPAN